MVVRYLPEPGETFLPGVSQGAEGQSSGLFNALTQSFQRARQIVEQASAGLGPAGRSFDQITGTDYLSDEERAWYLAQQGLAPQGGGTQPLGLPTSTPTPIAEEGVMPFGPNYQPPPLDFSGIRNPFATNAFTTGQGLLGQPPEAIQDVGFAPGPATPLPEEPNIIGRILDLLQVPGRTYRDLAGGELPQDQYPGQSLIQTLGTNIPGARAVQQGVGNVAETLLGSQPGEIPLPYTFGLLPERTTATPRQVTEAAIPTTIGELLLELLPGVGAVPGTASALRNAGRGLAGRALNAAPLESAAVRATGLPALGPRRVTAGMAVDSEPLDPVVARLLGISDEPSEALAAGMREVPQPKPSTPLAQMTDEELTAIERRLANRAANMEQRIDLRAADEGYADAQVIDMGRQLEIMEQDYDRVINEMSRRAMVQQGPSGPTVAGRRARRPVAPQESAAVRATGLPMAGPSRVTVAGQRAGRASPRIGDTLRAADGTEAQIIGETTAKIGNTVEESWTIRVGKEPEPRTISKQALTQSIQAGELTHLPGTTPSFRARKPPVVPQDQGLTETGSRVATGTGKATGRTLGQDMIASDLLDVEAWGIARDSMGFGERGFQVDYTVERVTPGRYLLKTDTGHEITGSADELGRWVDANLVDDAGRRNLKRTSSTAQTPEAPRGATPAAPEPNLGAQAVEGAVPADVQELIRRGAADPRSVSWAEINDAIDRTAPLTLGRSSYKSKQSALRALSDRLTGQAPPPQGAVPPRPPVEPPTGGAGVPPPVSTRGRTGIDNALTMAEANVSSTKGIGLAGKPRPVVVAQTARQGTAGTEYTRFSRSFVGNAKAADDAWQVSPPRYVGPQTNPAKGTLVDFLERPDAYYADVSPELQAAKARWGKGSLESLDYLRQNYDVDITPFTPEEGGVYVHHVETETAREAKRVGGRNLASVDRLGIEKERGYKAIGDRMAADKTFQPELDIYRIADDQAMQMAEVAARATYKAGVGGKTRPEVIAELHPQLAKRWEALHRALNGLRSTRGRLDDRVAGAIDSFIHSDGEPDDLLALEEALQGAKVGANAVGVQGRNFGKTANELRAEIKKVQGIISSIRPAWRTAGTGQYVVDPVTRRYMTPEMARASKNISQTSIGVDFLDSALNVAEEARIISLGAGDFSPVTIGQGFLGAMGHPLTLARNVAGLAKAARVSGEKLWASVDQELLDLYQQAQGYSVMRSSGAVPELREPGRGLEHLAGVTVGGKATAPLRAVGRGIRASNEATSKVVEYGRFKAWESDYKLLRRLNSRMTPQQAAAEAAAGVNTIAPQLNLTTSGASPIMRRIIGAPANSAAFAAAPVRLSRDMTAGVTQFGKALLSGKSPMNAWQSLQGRQQIALIRGTTMIGSISGIAAASAALFGEKPNMTRGQRALAAIDPRSNDFWKVKTPGGGSIPIGSPFRSAVTAVRTGVREGPVTGLVQYGRGRIQAGIGNPLDLVMNRDWKGDPVFTGEGDWRHVKQGLLHVLKNANVLGSQAIEGAQQRGLQGGIEGAITGLGGFSYFEQSPFEQRDVSREQVAQEKYGKPYRELFTAEQLQVDADPRVAGKKQEARKTSAEMGSVLAKNSIALDEVRGTKAPQAEALDRQLANREISGGDARKEYDRLESELGTEAARLASTPEAKREIAELEKRRRTLTYAEQARLDYYAIFDQPGISTETGAFDYRRYREELDKWQAKYPDVKKEQVSPAKPLSPGHAQLEQDRITLRPYWENEDGLWERIKPTLPPGLVGNARDLDDLREQMTLRAAQRVGRNQAETDVQKFWSQPLVNGLSLAEMERIGRTAFLVQNQQLVPLLLKWNYNSWRTPPKYLLEAIR